MLPRWWLHLPLRSRPLDGTHVGGVNGKLCASELREAICNDVQTSPIQPVEIPKVVTRALHGICEPPLSTAKPRRPNTPAVAQLHGGGQGRLADAL